MRVQILQLKNIKDTDYSFMAFEYAINHGFKLNDYKQVYDDEFIFDNLSTETILDKLYMRFNINHPVDFRGHSLSVSDIVILDGVKYYCNPLGWKELKLWPEMKY